MPINNWDLSHFQTHDKNGYWTWHWFNNGKATNAWMMRTCKHSWNVKWGCQCVWRRGF